MLFQHDSYRSFLRDVFASKRSANPRYSLRRYASQLGIQPSLLSEIFLGKRNLSEGNAVKVAQSLSMGQQERDYLLLLVRLEKTKSPVLRSLLLEQLGKINPTSNKPRDLSVDTFLTISDWYHFAILRLIEIKDFEWSTKTVSAMLDIPEIEVIAALERLHRLDLIELVSPQSRPRKLASNLNVASSGQFNEALRKYHTQMLEKTHKSLTKHHPSRRFTGTEVVTLNPEQFQKCSAIIEECFQQILRLSSEERPGAEVYYVGINAFPLSERKIPKQKEIKP